MATRQSGPPPLDLRQIRAQLTSDQAASAYLLLGPDRYLKERLFDELLRWAGEDAVRYRGRAPEDLDAFLEHVRTPSLWGAKAVAMLAGVQSLAGAAQRPAAQRLTRYLKSPSPWAVVVLDLDDEDSSSAGVKTLRGALAAVCATYTCGQLTRDQTQKWVGQRLAGARVQSEVAGFLWERTDGMPEALDRELEKLELAAADGAPLTLDLVRLLVVSDEREEPFELTNAIESAQPTRAIAALHRALEHDPEPLRVLGALARYVRTVLRVAVAAEGGDTAAGIAKRLGLHPRRAEILARVARRVSVRRLERQLEAVVRTDRRLKRSAEPLLVLERLVSGMAWAGRERR